MPPPTASCGWASTTTASTARPTQARRSRLGTDPFARDRRRRTAAARDDVGDPPASLGLAAWADLSAGLPAAEIRSLLVDGGRLLVRSAAGSFLSVDGGVRWRAAELPELEAWHRFTSRGVELALPTYGRPAVLGRDTVGSYDAALVPAGDGFFRYEKDQFFLSIWEPKDVPTVPLTPEVLASFCVAAPRPVTGRDGVFECQPILDGDAIHDRLWAFEDARRRAIMTVYSHQLDRMARDRMRDSVRLVGPN